MLKKNVKTGAKSLDHQQLPRLPTKSTRGTPKLKPGQAAGPQLNRVEKHHWSPSSIRYFENNETWCGVKGARYVHNHEAGKYAHMSFAAILFSLPYIRHNFVLQEVIHRQPLAQSKKSRHTKAYQSGREGARFDHRPVTTLLLHGFKVSSTLPKAF